MNNPLKVSLENIIPLTEARDHFSQIVTEVQKDKLYVLTKGGKPAVAIIDVKYLEYLTGGEIDKTHLEKEIKKDPEKVGRPAMIEHTEVPKPKPVPPPPPPSPPSQASGVAGGPPAPMASPKPAGFAAPAAPKSEPPKPPMPPLSTPNQPPVPASTPDIKPQNPPAPPAPLKTPPPKGTPLGPADEANKINVQFYPDKSAGTPSNRISDDDKNPPAQYAGEEDKVEDMKID